MRARSPDLKRLTTSAAVRPALRHAHVERAVAAEREAAIRLVELHRRHADIEHDAIDACLGKFIEPGERPVHQPQPPGKRRGEVGSGLDGVGIAVDRHNVGAGGEQRPGIAACPKGAVDDGLAGARLERGRYLVEENRSVAGRSANGVDLRAMARHHSVSPAARFAVAAWRRLTSLERASVP